MACRERYAIPCSGYRAKREGLPPWDGLAALKHLTDFTTD
jgi:hypothetical protein